MTAEANEGYWFDHWELDGETVSQEEGITDAPDGSDSVIAAGALHIGTEEGHTLHAVFTSETSFDVAASEGGSVDITSSPRTKDGYNRSVINASANEGYWFDHWEVDGVRVEGDVEAEEDGSACVVPSGGICVGNS